MRRATTRWAQTCTVVLLAAGMTIGNGSPAAALATTGSITVTGFYSAYAVPNHTGSGYVYFTPLTCTDHWAGATSYGYGAGTGCTISLFATNDGGARAGLRFEGWYVPSNSSTTYGLAFTSSPISYLFGAHTGTGVVRTDQYEGPAVIDYAQGPLDICVAFCGYEYASGVFTMSIDYVAH